MIATGMRLQWQPKAGEQRAAHDGATTGSPNKPWNSAAIGFVTSVAAGPITRYPDTPAATKAAIMGWKMPETRSIARAASPMGFSTAVAGGRSSKPPCASTASYTSSTLSPTTT